MGDTLEICFVGSTVKQWNMFEEDKKKGVAMDGLMF